MEHTVKNGFLVVVEGVDGAGKSTVLKRLATHCRERRFLHVSSREPTDGPFGKTLRASATTGRLSLQEELELFIQDRRQHVDELIRPSLEAGSIVLLDRYYFSTAAYQGARGADPDLILARNEEFAPPPNLLLLLDCPPSCTLERVKARGDVPNEFERREALEAVRRIFLSIRRPFIRVVDASQGAETVAENCVRILEEMLPRIHG